MKHIGRKKYLYFYPILLLFAITILQIFFATPTDAADNYYDLNTTAFHSNSFAGGTGTSTNPYLISNAKELARISYLYNNTTSYSGTYFKLINDIDWSTATTTVNGITYNLYWTPIGKNSTYDFNGHIIGNNYKILNLKVGNSTNWSKYRYAGFIGYSNAVSSVENLTIFGTIYGSTYAGGFCAYSNSTITLENCTSWVTVYSGSTTYYSSTTAGGLVGYAKSATITNCINIYNVYARSSTSYAQYSGGIVGQTSSSGTTKISNCFNRGNISNIECSTGYSGGIIGYLNGSSSSLITACRNTGMIDSGISGSSKYAGGIAGYANVDINKCENSGAIFSGSSLTTTSYAGGIAGYSTNNSYVTNCLNSGSIYGFAKNKSTSSTSLSYTFTGEYTTDFYKSWPNSARLRNGTMAWSGITLPCSQFNSYDNTYKGGIVGYSNNTISNCVNRGTIEENYITTTVNVGIWDMRESVIWNNKTKWYEPFASITYTIVYTSGLTFGQICGNNITVVNCYYTVSNPTIPSNISYSYRRVNYSIRGAYNNASITGENYVDPGSGTLNNNESDPNSGIFQISYNNNNIKLKHTMGSGYEFFNYNLSKDIDISGTYKTDVSANNLSDSIWFGSGSNLKIRDIYWEGSAESFN